MSFKFPFVDIANVRLSSTRGYNIEGARYWKIYNKGQFNAISKTNNVQQKPIRMHREHTGTHRNARESTGAHGSSR